MCVCRARCACVPEYWPRAPTDIRPAPFGVQGCLPIGLLGLCDRGAGANGIGRQMRHCSQRHGMEFEGA
eukprot:5502596-Lingulodinium_polyedra.AAC.1